MTSVTSGFQDAVGFLETGVKPSQQDQEDCQTQWAELEVCGCCEGRESGVVCLGQSVTGACSWRTVSLFMVQHTVA